MTRGPVWFATPSLQETFTLTILLAYPGASPCLFDATSHELTMLNVLQKAPITLTILRTDSIHKLDNLAFMYVVLCSYIYLPVFTMQEQTPDSVS